MKPLKPSGFKGLTDRLLALVRESDDEKLVVQWSLTPSVFQVVNAAHVRGKRVKRSRFHDLAGALFRGAQRLFDNLIE